MPAHGADVDATDSRGGTTLHRAAYFGRKDVVALLLGHGAGVNTQNMAGLTRSWPSKPRFTYSPGLAPTTRLNALLNAASDS